MPLKKGKSAKVHSANVKLMMDEYKTMGKIGTSHPANMKKAMAQANAIAYSQAGSKPKAKKELKRK